MGLGPPQVPQARGARLGLELFDDRHHFPTVLASDMSMPFVLVRIDMLGHEASELLPQLLHLGRIVEVHAALLKIFSTCCQPSCAMGFARMPASRACALAAVPSTTRFMIPCRIAAMRKRL